MFTRLPCLVLVVLAAAVAPAAPAVSPAVTAAASLTIEADRPLGPVNRLAFGHNMEAADGRGIFSDRTDASGLRTGQQMWDPVKRAPVPEVLAKAREIGMGMLRYPGGCLAHGFDWKKAVGPLEARGDWQFGIDEYIELCRRIGAEPLITVSDYTGTPQAQGELVEYLNAPAVVAHPWAMKRKLWGHTEPYRVRFFELGNESDHGNHNLLPKLRFTAEQYARYAIETAAAMRVMDPTIQIGLITPPGPAQDAANPWNRTVFRLAGSVADFVIIHVYTPVVSGGAPDAQDPPERISAACMAVGDQLERHLAEYRQVVREACGRALPLAITEYNIGAVQEQPVPYRFTYAAALMCADDVRIALQPANHVLMANYWHFNNGYWGMLQTRRGLVEKPAFPLYRLWGQHFGRTLVDVQVDTPRAAFEGMAGVRQAEGERDQPSRPLATLVPKQWTLQELNRHGCRAGFETNGVLSIRLDGVTRAAYPTLAVLTPPPGVTGCDYRLSYEGRFQPDPDSGSAVLGLGLCDMRGWEATHSAIAVTGAQAARAWQPFDGLFHARPDAPGVTISARIEELSGAVRGLLELRNIVTTASTRETCAGYALVTATASLSEDGRTLYLIAFNKSLTEALDTQIRVHGFRPATAAVWQVQAASMTATDGVVETLHGSPVQLDAAGFSLTLPAHSMTAVECRMVR